MVLGTLVKSFLSLGAPLRLSGQSRPVHRPPARGARIPLPGDLQRRSPT